MRCLYMDLLVINSLFFNAGVTFHSRGPFRCFIQFYYSHSFFLTTFQNI